jgi:hypothetical protein
MTCVSDNGRMDSMPEDTSAVVARTGWNSRVLELLHGAVLDEMRWKDAFLELNVPDEALMALAEAVANRISYAFAVKWSPDWVEDGKPHKWNDDEGWHARCNDCLAESHASPTEDEVIGWFDDHVHQQHFSHD